MMRLVEKLLKGELVGRNTRAKHTTEGQVFEGKIVDETKNMIVLSTSTGQKQLPKISYDFEFHTEAGIIRVQGRHFLGRSEARLKTRLKKNGKTN